MMSLADLSLNSKIFSISWYSVESITPDFEPSVINNLSSSSEWNLSDSVTGLIPNNLRIKFAVPFKALITGLKIL